MFFELRGSYEKQMREWEDKMNGPDSVSDSLLQVNRVIAPDHI